MFIKPRPCRTLTAPTRLVIHVHVYSETRIVIAFAFISCAPSVIPGQPHVLCCPIGQSQWQHRVQKPTSSTTTHTTPLRNSSFGNSFQMTSTRRKTKAAAAAAAAQQEVASSQDAPSASASLAFTISLPPDIDLDVLSALIPGESLEAPSEDTVLHLYRTLLAHVTQVDAVTREVEELRAEAEKKEVELDQAYQDRENDKKELESVSDNLQKELRTIKAQRDELGM